MSHLPEILVLPHNHFDPTWRRCFDCPADYSGVRVRSYAEIEDMVFSRALELSAKGFTHSEGTQFTREGLRYNQPEFQVPPFLIQGDVAITAWKPAEDGKGWILRLQETLGKGTGIKIEFGHKVQIIPCDLLERPNGNDSVRVAFWQGKLHRHGILTLRLE